MNKINGTITGVVLLAVSLALSACGAIPTAADRAQEGPRGVATEATEGSSVAYNSGLGTVVYNAKTSAKCKRVRSTGSNMRRSSCRNRDTGSQPVREATYTEPTPVLMPGMNRTSPE